MGAAPESVKKMFTSKQSWWGTMWRWGKRAAQWAWKMFRALGPIGWLIIALVIAFAFIWYWQRRRKVKRVNVKEKKDLHGAVTAFLGM